MTAFWHYAFFSFLIDRQLKHKVFHPLFIVLVAKDKLT